MSLTTGGLNNGGNKITNVANGTADTDAVNFSQLQAMGSAAKTHYYSVNSTETGADSNYNNDGATGVDALAAGVKAKAEQRNSVAIGNQAQVVDSPANPSSGSIAIGDKAKAQGDLAVALGAGATVSGESAAGGIAIGAAASSNNGGMAVGSGANAGNGTAMIPGLPVRLNNNVALGDSAKVKDDTNFNVALGSFSIAGETDLTATPYKPTANAVVAGVAEAGVQLGEVSVGGDNTAGMGQKLYRRVTNVAAGAADTDAVNVSQLKAAQAAATSKVEAGDGITVTSKVDNTTGSTTYTVAADTTALTVGDGNNGNPVGKVIEPTGADANKLATAGDIAKAINNSGFTLTAQGEATTASQVNPGETVDLRNTDGNIVVQKTAADNTISFDLASTVKIGPAAGGKPITINGTVGTISGLTGNLPATSSSTPYTTDQEAPANAAAISGNAATVGDVLNAGWNLQGNGTAVDFVKPYDTVNFADGTGTTVTTQTTGSVTTVKVNVNAQNIAETAQLPVVYTQADGSKVYKHTDGNFYDAPNGAGNQVAAGDVIASMQSAGGSTTAPTKLANVAAGTANTDAVNVSQLKGAADALGGGAGIADGSDPAVPAGTFIQPSYSITKTDGTTYPVANNVGTALSNLNAEVVKPITFAGDSGADSARKLGEKLTIKGGVTDANKLTDNNIGIVSDGNGTLTAKLAQNIDLGDNGSVKTGDTKMDNSGITIAAPTPTNPANTVSLTKDGLNNGGNKITNVANGAADTDAVNVSQLKAAQAAATSKVEAGDGITVTSKVDNTTGSTTYTVAADTTALTVGDGNNGNPVGKVIEPTGADANKLATAGDIAKAINNSGFQATAGGNLASGSTATPTTVKPGQKVTFAAGDGLTVKQDVNGTTGDQTYTYALNAQAVVQNAQTPVVYTKADGSKVYKHTDGNFYDKPEGQAGAQQVQPGDVIARMQDAGGDTTKPTTLGNVKSNLADASTVTTNPTGNDRATLTANGKGNNAATVNDVLNAGFTVQGNGTDKDFVTHGDTINFVNGQGTVAKVNTTGGVTEVKFDTPLTYVDPAGQASNAPSNKVNLVGVAAGDAVTLGNVADGNIAANSKDAVNGGQLHTTNQNVANNATNIAKGINFGGTTGSNNYQLGQTINVTGDDNITSTTVTGGAKLALNPNLSVTSVTTKDAAGNQTVTNGSGVTITPAAAGSSPVSLTTGGLDNGGNKITNVGAGTNPNDAVNVGQLNQALGAISGSNNANIVALDAKVNDVANTANAGVAQAIATAGLPQAYLPGKNMVAVGGGYYKGETGYAIGFSTISDNGNWIIKATGSGNSRGNFGGSIGAGYQW
ncbi:hypothetical protein A7P95_00710 [Eikenella longinqua]|uniref:Adhesin n=1 Tax=Eikenella longinqua TaxID=1795827 RepID=A0A1A9S2R2_9NEIS|nr:hypothetical protein A7P95_00710 [Eikenella longinqua]